MQNGDHATPQPALMPMAQRLAYYGALMSDLVAHAERHGVIVTVSRVPNEGFAMGNHHAHVEAYVSHAARMLPEKRLVLASSSGVQ